MKILVSGSLVYDRIMFYSGRFSDQIMPDKIHVLNLSFVTEKFKEYLGGTAGNIAYGLALLGEKPEIISAAGRDFAPYREKLTSLGVGLERVSIQDKEATATATIMTDIADNQIAALSIGAMAYPCVIEKMPTSKETFAIISPGNEEDMRKLATMYKEAGVPYIYDPGQQIPALRAEDLKSGIEGAKIFISNDYELAQVLEKTGWTKKNILERVEILITTLGEKGSNVQTKENEIQIPVVKVGEVLDPTGAGDAYRAGFTKGLIMKWPLEVAAKFGAVMASHAIETHGAQEYKVTFSDACARYEHFFGNQPGGLV